MPINANLYLTTLISYQTASLFGYSVGFIGGILVLPSFLSHFHLSSLPPPALAAAQSRIVTLWLVGALMGVPLGMPVCSKWGRKWCLRLSACLYVAGACLQLSGWGGVGAFEVGRWLNGGGVGCGTLVGPMFISEISPPALRGTLMSGYQTILQLSALAGFWGAYLSNSFFSDSSVLQWQIPVAIQLIPGVLLLLGTFAIPETPRFLAEKGRWSECERAVVWLHGFETWEEWKAEGEMEELRQAARASEVLKGKKINFAREVMRKGVRGRLGVGIGLMIAQNMVGLNALNYYAPTIFISAGFSSISLSLFLTGVFGVVKLLSAIAFMFIFVKIKGNRFWLLFGSALCGISMFILAYFVKTLSPHEGAKLTLGGVVSVLTVYIFAFSFSVSLGPISWNVCSEIFPLHINAKCCAITTCTQWLFQIVIASITPRLLASVGWVTYIIYAIFCIITTIWVYFFVPETRNVALGRAMDEVFGVQGVAGDDDQEEVMEVEETTALLGTRNEMVGGTGAGRMRRASLASYT